MSLQSVFQEALHKNESVPSQEEAVLQADENVKQAWGSIVPTITGTAQWMWQEQVPGPTGAFTPGWNPLTKLTASQPLFQGYREWNGLDQAKRLRGQQRNLQDSVELNLYRGVVTSYYQILSLERDINNLRDSIRYLNEEISLLQHWHKIGRAQSTDVLTAQSTVTAQEVTIEQDIATLKAARDQFALTTGLPADTKLDDDAQGFSPKLDTLEAYLGRMKDRPEVKANQEALVASSDNISVQKANHIPSLALTADYYFLRAGIQQNVDWDAMVVLSVPIFAGGVTQSKVRVAYSQDRQTQLALSLAERTAAQEIRQYFDAVSSDLRQLALNTRNVEVNEANYKEEEKYLRLGLVPYLNVITALTNYIQSKRTLDSNRFNLKSDYTHLSTAVASSKSSL